MVELTAAQLDALRRLLKKLEFSRLGLVAELDGSVVFILRDTQDNEQRIKVDEWGQGRLI